MSEEKAKEIIARNLRIWRTRKHFRNFLKKDPELTKARLRSNALRDLIGTEKTYVDALTVLVKVYLEPLKTTKKKLLPPNDVKVIFSNVEQILQINSELLRTLNQAMQSWPQRRIGAGFKATAPYLKAYTTYINNYNIANDTLLACEKKYTAFARFLAKRNALPECKGLNLQSFLIMPVQRIPRYVMLFQELIKNTPEDHIEYNTLNDCLVSIQGIASFVNETKRQHEGKEILLLLKELIGDRYQVGRAQPTKQSTNKAATHTTVP
eukprot:GEZU01022734.1.p1 GENE.GEZU01022734.1~~GEZU01022734.1.p1  ORF type:complete len:266 (+),score=46.80 GEZU01022734.1:3-800(+)